MPHSSEKKKSSVTLEQLLHVKRSERPSPAFWEEFDRELHRRQLATVVVAQPWRARISHVLISALRRAAPVGAAAAAIVAGFVAFNRGQEETAPSVQLSQKELPSQPIVAVREEPLSIVATVATPTPPMVNTSTALQPEARYVTPELVSVISPARSFVTVSAPRTLSASGSHVDTYMTNTLTTGPVLHAVAQPSAGSF